MKHDVFLIGTYHKTGTVWMQRVFRNLAETLNISFQGSHLGTGHIEPMAGFYLDDHSQFPESLLGAPHAGFRMIRDPRDVVISGAHYHAKSHEKWLHQPRDDMDGLTYQQAITARAEGTERYLFEMQHVARSTCSQMIEGITGLPDFLTVKYETWMVDDTMTNFADTMRSLGMDDNEREAARETFFKFSLFGEGRHVDKHTRSGKVAQWRQMYSRAMGEAFLEHYGDDLLTLGYEENHDWVTSLPAD